MSQLFFKKPFQDAIRAGRKCTTIRRWDKPMVKVGQQAFSPGLGWLAIESVDAIELDGLSDSDATDDGFATVTELRQLLFSMYPKHASDGKRWFRVRFRLHCDLARRDDTPTLF